MEKVFTAIGNFTVYVESYFALYADCSTLFATECMKHSSELPTQKLKVLGLAILSPSLVVSKLLIPTSNPTDLLQAGGLNVSYLPTRKRANVHADLRHSRRLASFQWTAPTNWQSFSTFPQPPQPLPSECRLVNSAEPPLCFFLKLGYLARPAKKLNAFASV